MGTILKTTSSTESNVAKIQTATPEGTGEKAMQHTMALSSSKQPSVTINGQARVVIESVTPEIDSGRFPIKRTAGEKVVVQANAFGDGHDAVAVVLRYRVSTDTAWQEVAMRPLAGDRWEGEFTVERVGVYEYTIQGWVDRFSTWHRDFQKRVAAGQQTQVDLLVGADLVEEAAERAPEPDGDSLRQWGRRLRGDGALGHARQLCEDKELVALMQRHSLRDFPTTYDRDLRVTVERKRAGFSAWYEMFPRSASDEPGRHGTLKDVEARLPYVAAMGFDVLYLPPIHPIGESFRKGKNNVEQPEDGDVGSPWAIGSSAGGHKATHPQLGGLEDFRSLVAAAEELGIEIALDIAFQCSPDHPYVKEYPEWFRLRPDGTIQYAENPPKKYQDIYPFDFESKDWWSLWNELKGIFDFWIEQGVKVFRVDNPHTKPFAFWEWCIGEIKSAHPDVLFLSEAFTRPTIMHRLAKLGFTQSYTYFAWRNTKRELTEYVTALNCSEVREFLRPNFWPNTPDILTEYLQLGGRPAFMSRLVLAALLSPNYGIYGPPFEHCWNAPREPDSEEYLDSEKYQIYHHDLDRPDSLKDFIARVNRLRREHAALQTNQNLRFHEVDNEEIICFSKSSEDRSQIVLAVVSLDPHHRQSGWVELPLEDFGLDTDRPCQVHDLLSDARFLWHGRRNYVELNPEIVPAHVFQVRRRVRTEHDFEYYL